MWSQSIDAWKDYALKLVGVVDDEELEEISKLPALWQKQIFIFQFQYCVDALTARIDAEKAPSDCKEELIQKHEGKLKWRAFGRFLEWLS